MAAAFTPVTTRVHAADGSLLAEYARERRLFQPIETIPPLVIDADQVDLAIAAVHAVLQADG